MSIFFYFLVFSTGLLLNLFIYIYYQLNKNNHVINFGIFNLTFFFSFLFWLFKEYNTNVFYKNVLHRISFGFQLITILFIMFFIYEIIVEKNINKIFFYKTFLFILVFLIISIDLFIKNIDIRIYKLISNILFTSIFVELSLIMLFYSKKTSSKLQSRIIKGIVFILIGTSIEEVLHKIFRIPDDCDAILILNIFFIIYIIKKIFIEIKNLKEKVKKSDKFTFNTLEEKFTDHNLTDREKEIAVLIIKGKRNQEIADELFISINTVKIHIYNIYKKFNINKRTDFLSLFLNKSND